MELGKRKTAVVSLRPMKRTRSTSLASLPQEATKNMGVYKISGSPKRKSYRPKQRRIDFTSLTLLKRYFTSFNSCLVCSTQYVQLLLPFVSRAGYGARCVCLPLVLETHYLKYFCSTKVDTAFIQLLYAPWDSCGPDITNRYYWRVLTCIDLELTIGFVIQFFTAKKKHESLAILAPLEAYRASL